MFLIRFFKQQDWRYAIPCLIFLGLFTHYIDLGSIEFLRNHDLALHFICATGFLICYSLKFARKHNNLLIDQLKMIFYFLFFTTYILFSEDNYIGRAIEMLLPVFLFYLYFYSLLIFYNEQMEAQGKSIRKPVWLIVIIIQSIVVLGVIVWSITQKVEAEKQKVLAMTAKVAKDELEHQAIENEKRLEKEVEKYKLMLDSLNAKK